MCRFSNFVFPVVFHFIARSAQNARLAKQPAFFTALRNSAGYGKKVKPVFAISNRQPSSFTRQQVQDDNLVVQAKNFQYRKARNLNTMDYFYTVLFS